ncbi:hypothetical protein ACVNPS_00325 [Candidatus Bipolaricaulota sp. J31]
MPWGFYGRRYFGWGRGWGGRGSWGGRGKPYPFCLLFPWLPRGWWRFGYGPYAGYPAPYSWWRPRVYGPYPWAR